MTMLKINTSTSPVSLKEMSTAEQDYVTYVILNKFASSNTGVGTVSINPASTVGLTSIGSATDTYRNFAVGAHPIDNTVITTANTYTAYQNLGTATESLTRPVEYSSGIKEATETTVNTEIIATVAANLVANGIGSYAISTSAPSGGTWTTEFTLVNTIGPGNIANTYLWRKTAGASVPSTVRPLKINSTSPISLKEMSDAEIETLTDRLRNRIVTAGIGTYKFQATTPVGGTWVTQGTAFSDTRNTATNQNYSGNYTGDYTGSYRLFYAGFAGTLYTGTYRGYYAGAYTGMTVNSATESISSTYLWVRTA